MKSNENMLSFIEPEKSKSETETKTESVSAPKDETDSVAKATENGPSDDEEVFVCKVRIHDADLKDAGQWKCEVTDKYGVASTSCNLMVFGKLLFWNVT